MKALDLISDWVELARKGGYNADELAALCEVSPTTLRRFFKTAYCRPPQEWLNELRLWHALELLCDGMAVKQVAFTLNFGSVAHFCRQFHAYHGCTPRLAVALFMNRRRRVTAVLVQNENEPFSVPWRGAEFRMLARPRRTLSSFN